MKYSLYLIFFLLLTSILWSCSRRSMPEAKPVFATDGKYDSGPPVQGASGQLDKAAQSIYRLNVISFYVSYTFERSTRMTLGRFDKGNAEQHAVSRTVSNHSVLGTATVVYVDSDKAALLTCAHVVDSKDTIITYFPDSSGVIMRVAIKLNQKNYVAGLENPMVKVMAVDDKHDIALLKASVLPGEGVRMMPFPIGKSSELDWGTFVYVMGFPNGHKMVESGIVSRPDNNNGFFLTNAIFNRGISGGPVFAIRDGAPHFEWVGIASSSSVTDILYLKPDIGKSDTYSKSKSYKGKILIDNKKILNYGVTFSVSMAEIIRFIKSIKPRLERQGFATQQFFYH